MIDCVEKPVFFKSWLVCLSGSFFLFYAMIQMGFVNTISGDLMQFFHATPVQLGQLASTYLYTDALVLLPAGLMMDRFSTRHLLLFFMSLSVIAMFIFATTHSLIVAGICHGVMGIGNAFSFLGCLRLAGSWFPQEKRGFVMAISVTMGLLGGLIAQAPFAYLVASVGWKEALFLNGVLGLLILSIMIIFVKNKHRNEKHFTLGLLESIKKASQNLQNIICGFYACFLYFPLMLLGSVWGNLYLTQVRHLSSKHASLTASMIFLGLILGSPILGKASDFFGVRRQPMILGAILVLAIMLFILYFPGLSFEELTALFFLLGFFSSAQVITYPTVIGSNPENITSTAMSVVAIIVNLGAAMAQPLLGFLLSLNNHKFLATYTNADYLRAFSPISICFFIAIFLAMRIRNPEKKRYG